MPQPLDIALAAAKQAGDILQRLYKTTTETLKAEHNLVTEADLEAERAIVSCIEAAFPDHTIYGEESGIRRGTLNSEHLWIVDPLDGTTSYAHGIPHFSISIAYAVKGTVQAGVVFDPIHNELFYATAGGGSFLNDKPITVSLRKTLSEAVIVTGFYYERGEMVVQTLERIKDLLNICKIHDIRRTGSAALDFCWVACGRFEGYFECKLSPWDFAAGMLIVREAGGCCFDRAGNYLQLDSLGVVACNNHIAREFLDVVAWRE